MSRKALLEPIYINATATAPLKEPNPIALAAAKTQSLAASFNTLSTSVKYHDNLSYQTVITTTNSTGRMVLQGSNDNVNWCDLTTSAVVAASNDDAVINVNQFPFAFMRMAYTSTIAGTGTCSIVLMARSVGA